MSKLLKSRLALGLSSLFLACGGSANEVPSRASMVRDSAGIEIVENYAPEFKDGEWHVDTMPTLVLGSPDFETAGWIGTIYPYVRMTDGRYVINSTWPPQVRIYDRKGRPVRQIWRGDTILADSQPEGVRLALKGDTIAVTVTRGKTQTVFHFDTVGRVLGKQVLPAPIPPVGPPGFRLITDLSTDGSRLLWIKRLKEPAESLKDEFTYSSGLLTYVVTDRENHVDTIGQYPDLLRRARMPDAEMDWYLADALEHPFYSVATHSIQGGDPLRIYIADGASRDIKVHDDKGRLIRIIRRMTLPIAMTDSLWQAGRASRLAWQVDSLKRQRTAKILDQYPFPQKFLPTVNGLRLGKDGLLWVFTPGDNWHVFDREGKWLARVVLPKLDQSEVGVDFVVGWQYGPVENKIVREFRLVRGRN